MIETVKKDYPLTYQRMVDVVKKEMVGQESYGYTAEDAVKVLFMSPRVLIEFFDNQNIHIDTSYLDEEGFDVEIRAEKIYQKPFDKREQAEFYGVQQAFKILEKQLESARK